MNEASSDYPVRLKPDTTKDILVRLTWFFAIALRAPLKPDTTEDILVRLKPG